ncbi:hypothetical protein, conserved [Plasmodium gonderi]|uniref:Uncharacterized protein n=1 Tax=Plasmodium gonderi TaxID=77519 RepID=A0A1Y1JFS7_PLAGO|nr:hypothetical protein, conserved [Plasmodium gonderi]GAW80067.1 hypothetical protein, conserved [Plasmodium gonderi]
MKNLQKCKIVCLTKQLLNQRSVKVRLYGTAVWSKLTNIENAIVKCEQISGKAFWESQDIIKKGTAMTLTTNVKSKDTTAKAVNVENSCGQSELVKQIRKFCKKDDLCSMYKFNENFLHLLKMKQLNEKDFSIIVHLLSKKKVHSNSFWKRIANTENINFIFQMNLKQIILTFYSISNSYKYINLTFLNEYTDNLIFILNCQKYFISLTRRKKGIQKKTSEHFEGHNCLAYNESELLNLSQDNNLTYQESLCNFQTDDYAINKSSNMSKEKEKITWKNLIDKQNYKNISSLFRNKKNHLNFLDLTLICNTYSKLNNLEHLQNVEELKKVMYKLFLYFLFFYKINFDHLILFMHSYTRVRGNIDKCVLRKVQKVLLNPENGLCQNLYKLRNIHILDICSLNMLMHVFQRTNFKDEKMFKEVILSVVLNLNLKYEKRIKTKGSVLSGDDYCWTDCYALCDDIIGYSPVYFQESKNSTTNQGTNIGITNSSSHYSYHMDMVKKKKILIEHFSKKDNTYILEKEHLVKLKKKDFCFLVYNINKLRIKNYYNIYEYIKYESENNIKLLNVYNCCIILDCLVNLNLLDEKLFKKILTNLKILFDKNHYNEKDVTDIFVCLCKYGQTNSAQHTEIHNFLKSLYLKIQTRLKKYSYISLISIFCSSSYFNILLDNNVVQDICIDILNNFNTVDIKSLLSILYFLKSKNYEISTFFFNTIIEKVLSKIKDPHFFFCSFHILSIYASKTLQKKDHILDKLVQVMKQNEHLLGVKEKLIISLQIFVTPELILNEAFFQFCQKTFEDILCSSDKQKYTVLNHMDQINTITPKVVNHKNKNDNFIPFFTNCNHNNLDFSTDINIAELKIFLLLLLSDMYEKKPLVFKKRNFLIKEEKKNKNLKYQNNQLSKCKLEIIFSNIYIRLQNDCLSYFLKTNISLFDHQKYAKQLNIKKIKNYTMNLGSIMHSNEVEKKLKIDHAAALKIYNNDMSKYFPEFEEILFNVIKICYEDFFIYTFFAKKKDEFLVNYKSQNICHNYADSFLLHNNDNLIIKLKKNMFINSFHIAYVFKPFQ